MSSIIENHLNFYEKQNKKIFNYALLQLKQEYENKDKEIFNSNWRKENGYIPHGVRKRTLITIFGKVTYKRHRYLIWNKNHYQFTYLSDIALGIKKYQRVTTHLHIKILSLIAQGKRYQDILDCFPTANLTINTISNLINRTKIDSLDEIIAKKVTPIKLDKYLYVNIDDTFLNLKENNKKQQFRIRVVLFHTGYDLEKSKDNKKILKNSKIYVFLTKKEERINTKAFFEKIQKIASNFYSNSKQTKVIISGDGAPWIRNSQKYWPNSVYILDRFHTVRKIRQLFNPNNRNLQPIYETLRFLFFNGDYQAMIQTLSDLWFHDNYKNLKLKQLKYYLINNEKSQGISNQNQNFNIGCNIESTISHHVKSLLGYGSKAFSKNTYLKILTLHIADFNGININELLKENFIN
ncbi:Mbov_0401 family ICE element transposase-like protein [Spiroplasma platyhelix]|uniref:Transposase n=1 Tax=Spiroplasma platyhelix PALS-1 TaxID=1276218 RepID=A0A846U9F4_9MOLU|nr:UPF0236 family protein [Spiroplasma platyhelix]MBE4704133.1 hypothetical protein [Spiroplasma platyhelix PALS-1]NKE38503.1 hypothetical protein [Spiroplasma platyhelix PALS-1]UJB29391.1 hypothetical protein SPLAT_v1c06270 [Spiroplasma platyhelix PALS-1]